MARSIEMQPASPDALERTFLIRNPETGATESKVVSLPDIADPIQRNQRFRAIGQEAALNLGAELSFGESLATEEELPLLERPITRAAVGKKLGKLREGAIESAPAIGATVLAGLSGVPGPVGVGARALKKAGPVAKLLRPLQERATTEVTKRTIAGAGLGEAGGTAVKRAATGESTFGEDVPGTLNELQELTKAGLFGTVFEAGAGALGKAIGLGMQKFRQGLAPNPEEVSRASKTTEDVLQEIAQADAKRTGKPLEDPTVSFGEKLMDPATGKVERVQPLTFIETALQDYPFSSGIFQTPRVLNKKLLQGEAARMVKFVERRGGIEGVARLLVEEAQGTQANTRKIISKLYNRLGTMTVGVPVSTGRTQQILLNFQNSNRTGLDTVTDIIKAIDDPAAISGRLAEGASVFERILGGLEKAAVKGEPGIPFEGGKDISFAEAGQLRSQLLAFARKSSGDPAVNQAQSIATTIAQALKIDLNKAAKQLSPEALRFFNQTQRFTSEAHANILTGARRKGGFSESAAALAIPALDLIGKNPSKAASVLLKPDNQITIAAIKQLSPTKWRVMKDALVDDIFLNASELSAPRKAGGSPVRQLKGVQLRKRLDQIGDPMLREILGPEESLQLRRLADALAVVDQKVTGLGKIAMSLVAFGQITAAGSAAVTSGFDPITTGGAVTLVVLTPRALAHLVRSPSTMRLLEKGFDALSASADPRQGMKLINRAIAQLGAQEANEATPTPLGPISPPAKEAGLPQKVF